uniref:Uncharacterized protein n=1 Tax=Ralstonia solanacearum TaxID=305 RepID=A0A0S4VRI1_RALSL|nr:protein of unknown function [Ralstonia solanacearum]CUV42137.1 protein of unknown function [Ralstonia solanacearum]CUV60399.1 protein of unknown function [Ralstonia solanacearum]
MQRGPHVLVALRGPDARVLDAAGFVVGARHVEGQAVLVDEDVTELRVHRRAGVGHGGLQVHFLRDGFLAARQQRRDEVARVGQALVDFPRIAQRRAAAGHELLGAERAQGIQRGGPFFELGVAAIAGGVVFDQVAREQHLLRRNPHHRVALGVSRAQVQDLHFQLAEEQRQFALEHQRRPGQAGHGLDAGEQAREALDLRLHVGLAALDDHLVRAAAGDDVLRALGKVGRRAQHPHRVVVRQYDVLDRLVGDGADAGDQVLRHRRRGGGVDDQHRIVADDDARVRVALGGVGIGVGGELGERDLFGLEVGLRGEGFGHVVNPCVVDYVWGNFRVVVRLGERAVGQTPYRASVDAVIIVPVDPGCA